MRTCPKCQRTYPDDTDFCSRDGTPLPSSVSATEVDLTAGLARRYKIIRRLGAGGMGAVFLAEQVALGNRPVAVKVLLRKLLDDPEFLQRFHSEAASTARIHHSNVITVYESGQSDDGAPYIAMEYLDGETLRQALKARGAMPVPEVVAIIQQVARGLNAAHKLGIIHRDLKPDNIFITRTDEGELAVKVMDFGIAKLRESATHTLTGMVLGTPAYMSFEQASGMRSDELDLRSDVYSLGIVVYEMLTGRVPFHSDTPLGYVSKHMTEEPPPFRAVAPGLAVGAEIEQAVMKALRKNRDERYASVLEFARDMAGALQEAPTAQIGGPLQPTLSVNPPGAKPQAAAPAPLRGSQERQTGAMVPTPPPMPSTTPQVDRIEPLSQHARMVAGPAALAATARPSKGPSRMRYILVGLLVVAAIIGALWYFSHRGSKQEVQQTRPASRGQSVPDGMVAIPGGTFMMGRDNAQDPEETPAHSVTVAAFYMDKTPVTNAKYAEFARATGRTAFESYPADQDNLPVTKVSWKDAQTYCEWKGDRLPTEAEWEYAARGSDRRLYPWGNNFSPLLTNSSLAGLGHSEPVGAHPDAASPFGVLDMSGNVWEWTADDYRPYPGHSRTFNIAPDAKVIRGGSYEADKLHVTTTTRNLDHASARSPIIGFRCAR